MFFQIDRCMKVKKSMVNLINSSSVLIEISGQYFLRYVNTNIKKIKFLSFITACMTYIPVNIYLQLIPEKSGPFTLFRE